MKTLISLELPADPAQRPAWLEQQLVGLRLGTLVDQLEVLLDLHEDVGPALEEICGDRLRDVFRRGLSSLSPEQIQNLIRHPWRLLELQEKVFVEGGAYWSSVPRTEEHNRLTETDWQALLPRLTDVENSEGQPVVPVQMATPSTASVPRRNQFRLWCGSLAAALMVTVGWWLMQPPAPKWGWDRPGALAVNLSAKDYLNHLADAADEWKHRRPEIQATLEQRLSDFRHGCQTLIDAPHPQLSPEDRTWLVGKCQDWAGKLDGQLADLRSGTKPMPQVLNEADTTIGNLIDALRKRAQEMEARPKSAAVAV